MEENSTLTQDKFVDIERRGDLTQLIERLEVTEEKSGLEISGLSAFWDDDGDLKVCGEAIFSEPPKSSCEVNVAVYDDLARVVDKRGCSVGNNNTTFNAFIVYCDTSKVDKISKIKIYITVN